MLCMDFFPYSVPDPWILRSCQLTSIVDLWSASSAEATDATVVLNSSSCIACTQTTRPRLAKTASGQASTRTESNPQAAHADSDPWAAPVHEAGIQQRRLPSGTASTREHQGLPATLRSCAALAYPPASQHRLASFLPPHPAATQAHTGPEAVSHRPHPNQTRANAREVPARRRAASFCWPLSCLSAPTCHASDTGRPCHCTNSAPTQATHILKTWEEFSVLTCPGDSMGKRQGTRAAPEDPPIRTPPNRGHSLRC